MTRTYTVRAWDAEHRELTLDFVIHGDEGLAGPWATRVRPGETLRFFGPGGAYTPDVTADWHLLVGDESALPAIARALETLPPGTPAHAFVEVTGPAEEQKIDSDVEVVWLHRGTARSARPCWRPYGRFGSPRAGRTPSCTARRPS